ncbi:TraI domain-containing protein [Pseudomonas carnis]|uniref:MobH family relaxase n=1 Tax=Pseudomonas carnis TaxID=2487355 RepID=UPI001C6FA6EF|nr:MobH family relaxase [Pseudomonas carnis]MBW9241005.1 TraI domain-containing protein [Pseudomonas carnis]
MQFLKKLFGIGKANAPASKRPGSLTDNQIQVLDLRSPEIQKYLKTGDEASLRYPPFQKGWLANVPGRVLLDAQASKVRQIASGIGLPPAEFNRLILPVLDAFADFVHMLPASQAHHHRGPGGLLAHSLEAAVHALNSCQVTSFDHDRYPAERIKRRDRWNVAAVLAALLHDVGKPLYDLRVTDGSAEKIWHPVANTIPEWAEEHSVDRYFIHWNPNRHEIHKHLSTTMVERLLHRDLRLWLMEAGQDLYFEMISAIACEDEKRLLTGLVIKADSSSVEADLRKYGGDASGQSAMGIGVPVASLVVDAMRLLKSVGTWKINESGQRVWVFGDGVFVVWAQGVRDITESLVEKGIKAVPRSPDALGEMLLDHNIIERSPEGSIYWSVAPEILNAGRSKPIKLKCVKLSSSTLLFPFEPLPASAVGTVGDDEHEMRFSVGSSATGDPVGSFPLTVSVIDRANSDLAELSADGAMTAMFTMPSEEAISAPQAAEIVHQQFKAPDFSVPAGIQDPFGAVTPKPTADQSFQQFPAQVQAPNTRPDAPAPIKQSSPKEPTQSGQKTPRTGAVHLVAIEDATDTTIRIKGADNTGMKPDSSIVVAGAIPVAELGIRVGGEGAPHLVPAGQVQTKRHKKKTRSEQDQSVAAEKSEMGAFASGANPTFNVPVDQSVKGSIGSHPPATDQTLSQCEASEANGDAARAYTYDFGDIDDEVLELAGMVLPDRSLLPDIKHKEQVLATEPGLDQDVFEEPQLTSVASDEFKLPQKETKLDTVSSKLVIPPELGLSDEFGFNNFDVDLSLQFIGEIPADSPLTVNLPKGVERFTDPVGITSHDSSGGFDLPPTDLPNHDYDPPIVELSPQEESFSFLTEEYDLPNLSAGVLLETPPEGLWDGPDLNRDADWPVFAEPLFQEAMTRPEHGSTSVTSFQLSNGQELKPLNRVQPAPEKLPKKEMVKRSNGSQKNSGRSPGGPGGIKVQSGSEVSSEIRVGQPRKLREPLSATPVKPPAMVEVQPLSSTGGDYSCAQDLAEEFDAYLEITPQLGRALKWYAENLDKTVSMISFKPFFTFEGQGFVIDDIPKLERAGWLWDDFTGTMNRKNPKGVLLTSYLGEIFEYLTNGKYRHSMASARNREEARYLANVAESAISLCKEHEMNGRRVVSIQPRKLSEISNALQVDESTLKRALIATHQYLMVRNNHVIELMD